jgi:hypothetical protein
MNPITEARELTAALRTLRGTTVGVACKAGQFAVTETVKVGRTFKTTHLTGWQSYSECLAEMRRLAHA